MPAFEVNGRWYDPPSRPIVVVCIDGCGDEYLSTSMAAGRLPHMARMAREGYRGMVRGALPSFTNTNNASIATGVPPNVTGIAGNFFLDPETGEEVMMNSARFLEIETIFSTAAEAGRKVAVITAKDKLREILGKNLKGIAFSAEKANQTTAETHGIEQVEELVGYPTPDIYSAAASLFVLQAGVALVESQRADFLYLSLTDYMQHKFAPDTEESLQFYEDMDTEFGKLLELDAVIAATADHGMNAKNNTQGEPNVVYLESELTRRFGPGVRVICPITDPYVKHHGALGSLVMVHLADDSQQTAIAAWLMSLPQVTEVYPRDVAARKLELPSRRIGDLTVMSARDVVLGRTPEDHDISMLGGGLRSHGGRYEEMVPMLVSEPLNPGHRALAEGDPRNFDIFDYACNGTVR